MRTFRQNWTRILKLTNPHSKTYNYTQIVVEAADSCDVKWDTMMEHFSNIISALALIAALSSLGLTIRALRANHDWNRRQFAAKMIEDWNPRTSSHRQAIERLRPGLIDIVRGNDKINVISLEDARAIYRSTPESPELWELRFHFIEILNYFEFVASCYHNEVCDEYMIEKSFRGVFMAWHKVLKNFIDEFAEARGYTHDKTPWGPYHILVEKWRTGPPLPDKRDRTDKVISAW